MGCGGSKHDVATGNTVSRRALRKKASNASYTSAVSTDASGHEPALPPPLADVKDITVSTDGWAGEGALLAHSPDKYFSSRKDDDPAVAAAAAGGEYFSPRYVPDGEDAIAKALEELAAETAAAAGTLDGKDGEKNGCGAAEGQALGGAAAPEGGNIDKPNGKVSVDLKEPILVEETKLEVTNRAERLGISETVNRLLKLHERTKWTN